MKRRTFLAGLLAAPPAALGLALGLKGYIEYHPHGGFTAHGPVEMELDYLTDPDQWFLADEQIGGDNVQSVPMENWRAIIGAGTT